MLAARFAAPLRFQEDLWNAILAGADEVRLPNGRLASSPVLSAFVMIDSEPSRVAALATELADVPGVAEVYSVAGGCDIVAIVRVRHHDELADVVTGRIGALSGIRSTRTMVAFKAYSARDLDALWDLDA